LLKKGLVISGGFRARRAPSPPIGSAANEPNTGFIVPLLKSFADRSRAAHMAQSLIGRVFAEGQQIRSANVIAFNLPPIIGLSTTCVYRKPKPAHNGEEVRNAAQVDAQAPSDPQAYCVNRSADFYPYRGEPCKSGYQLGSGNCRKTATPSNLGHRDADRRGYLQEKDMADPLVNRKPTRARGRFP
jgi:hypothetical protein